DVMIDRTNREGIATMHAEWFDPELSHQVFENALAAVALSFIALAALAALVVYVFVVYQCYRLTERPAKPRIAEPQIEPQSEPQRRRPHLVRRQSDAVQRFLILLLLACA